MDIEKLVNYIEQKTNSKVIYIYHTGSKLFCGNCKDTDIVAIIEGGSDFTHLPYFDGYDIFCYSLANIEQYAKFEELGRFTMYLYALAKSEPIYGTNPFADFDLLANKEPLVKQLVAQGKEMLINAKKTNGTNKDACLKQSIWLFANYFALVNNSLDFTAEQLDIIQKCHDNELPRSYAEDVYQKLLEMLPKQEPQEVEQPTISYDELVDSKIRARYTVSQEFAILRQRDTKPDEFAEYNAYCEQCKADAKAELGIE